MRQARQHLILEPLDVDLDEARQAIVRNQRIEGGDRHRERAIPFLTLPPSRAPRRGHEGGREVETVGLREFTCNVSCPASAPAADRRQVTERSRPWISRMTRAGPGLGFERNHPRAAAAGTTKSDRPHGSRCQTPDRRAGGTAVQGHPSAGAAACRRDRPEPNGQGRCTIAIRRSCGFGLERSEHDRATGGAPRRRDFPRRLPSPREWRKGPTSTRNFPKTGLEVKTANGIATR